MAKLKFMTDYHTAFDPKVFLDTYYKTYKGSEHEEGLLQFHVKACHNFWTSFQPPPSITMDGSDNVRHLEYGGGPVIAGLVSASPKVDRIVFAEYTEANRRAVFSWRASRPEAHDWSSLIKFVVSELEGVSNADAVKNREEEIKRKIKSIVPCDITKTPIVDLESIDIDKPFDVVSTSLCLEICVTSEREYKTAVAKLCTFLKPNGYLCMYGVLGETFYNVGKEKFFTFPLTKSVVQEAMEEAQIEDVKIDVMDVNYHEVSNTRSVFTAFGRKSAKAELT